MLDQPSDLKRLLFIFDQSIRSVLIHRMRSFLSMLGVMAGAAAIITLANISINSRDAVLRQFDGLGYRMTAVSVGAQETTNLLSEAEALSSVLSQYEEINRVFYYWGLNIVIEFRGQSFERPINGIPVDQQAMMGLRLKFGELFTEENLSDISILMGNQVYEDFANIGLTALPGNRLNLNGKVVRVAGVLDNQLDTEVFSPNGTVFLKRSSLEDLNLAIDYVGIIVLREPEYDYRQVEYILNSHLSANLPNSEFFIISPEDLIKSAAEQNRMFQILTVVLGLVSLIVGGIGIMNIMLVSVSERTPEIGVRLAVGARVSDIRIQFLVESTLLCVAGGLMGIILATIMTYIHTQLMQWPFAFSFSSVIAGLLSSVIIGLIFGYIPAASAAKLDPVKALNSV